MKIIHFAVDDKFIPFVQKTFEQAYPGENEYRVPGYSSESLKFVIPGSNVQVVDRSYWTSEAVADDLKKFDCLVIHYMNPLFMEGIRRAHPDLLIIWVGWGADYYYLIEPYLGNLLLEVTRQLTDDLGNRRQPLTEKWIDRAKKLASNPGRLLPYLKGRLLEKKQNITIHDVIHRIDLLWVNPEEMGMIEKALPDFKGKYHRVCYYSAEETFAVGPDRMAGPDLLIGNSATDTNNHLELFEELLKFDLGNSRLIVPLSYGDQVYGDEIVRIGRKRFGSRFVPIRDYMPLEDYYQTLSSCGTVLMNHVRQQAGTTIAAALYKGAKVYLRNENPVLTYYRNMGLKLFSIQDDLLPNKDIFGPLESDEMLSHRAILNAYWGHEAAISCALELKNYAERKRSFKA